MRSKALGSKAFRTVLTLQRPTLLPSWAAPKSESLKCKLLLMPLRGARGSNGEPAGPPLAWTFAMAAMEHTPPQATEASAEIVANLLENAFRYSPAGCAIGLASACPTGSASGTTGLRSPSEERELIFERGERGTTSRDRPGTGLGLGPGPRLGGAQWCRLLSSERGAMARFSTGPAAHRAMHSSTQLAGSQPCQQPAE
jgi:hypothetical protein